MAQARDFAVTGTDRRLDHFLCEQLPHLSRTKVQRLIQAGSAVSNGVHILTPSTVVHEGMVIWFVEPDPDPDTPPADATLEVPILYEDTEILVVIKPVGMVTHPNTFVEKGTLVQALLAQRPEIAAALYDSTSAISRLRPGIVHRLDKDTSGLLVVAKTRPALLKLAEQFHTRQVAKEYETLVYGTLREARTVDAPIHRKVGSRKNQMVASHDKEVGREAITHFTPVQTFAPYAAWPEEFATRVRVVIETGRTHQIRVHAKFIGHPVLGDLTYTNKPALKLSHKLNLTHQQLRAVTLSFDHPTTGKRLTFHAPD
jgi:23S rRNA pseudouridine1911/1915/1917 synthase